MKAWAERLTASRKFEIFINLVIVVNCLLIGVETYLKSNSIYTIQHICVIIFIIEICIRYIAAKDIKSFFTNVWNVFDFSLVVISLIPESVFSNAAAVTALRILRVFRVLRLVRTSPEIKLIISVLIRSFKALTYNALIFFIFIYLFAIIGVTIFKIPTAKTADAQTMELVKEYYQVSPNTPEVSPDPYGTLHEAMFTLFRVTTAEDWTDIRYNLIQASKMGVIHVPTWSITTFHIVWFCLSAFLLLNLLVGAVVNNYQVIMEEMKKDRQ